MSKLPKPYLVDDVPVTRGEIFKAALRFGYEGKFLSLAARLLRNKGFTVKHNKKKIQYYA